MKSAKMLADCQRFVYNVLSYKVSEGIFYGIPKGEPCGNFVGDLKIRRKKDGSFIK